MRKLQQYLCDNPSCASRLKEPQKCCSTADNLSTGTMEEVGGADDLVFYNIQLPEIRKRPIHICNVECTRSTSEACVTYLKPV